MSVSADLRVSASAGFADVAGQVQGLGIGTRELNLQGSLCNAACVGIFPKFHSSSL